MIFRKWLSLFFLCGMLTLAACGSAPQTTVVTKPAAPVKSVSIPTVVSTATPTALPIPTATIANPTRVSIPVIGVDAPIENVGIAADGAMATPTQNPWDGLGWFSTGPRPGEAGSAVINGHLDRPGGSPAVFWNLSKLHPGDAVIVTDANGKVLQFHVLRVASYAPDQAPVQEIFGNSGGTFLNLITCAGTWMPSENQTTLRLVIYTSL